MCGVGDEEYALIAAGQPDNEQAARLTKDEAIAKLKALLEAAPPAPATSGSAAATARPKPQPAPTSAKPIDPFAGGH